MEERLLLLGPLSTPEFKEAIIFWGTGKKFINSRMIVLENFDYPM